MAHRTKRLWTDEEKRSICFQTAAPGVSVARVAQRYAMNVNLIFTWLRDPRYAPEAPAEPDAACFLSVEIVDRPRHDDDKAAAEPAPAAGTIEIETAGGHRLRISGAYDAEALARLIRGLLKQTSTSHEIQFALRKATGHGVDRPVRTCFPFSHVTTTRRCRGATGQNALIGACIGTIDQRPAQSVSPRRRVRVPSILLFQGDTL